MLCFSLTGLINVFFYSLEQGVFCEKAQRTHCELKLFSVRGLQIFVQKPLTSVKLKVNYKNGNHENWKSKNIWI